MRISMKKYLIILLLCPIIGISYGQVNYKQTDSIEGKRVIASTLLKDHYLSLDNGEFFGSDYGDQGKVEVTQEIGQHELFEIIKIEENIYCIASTDIKSRYLSLNGAHVYPGTTVKTGIVRIQVYIGGYERFKFIKQNDGSYVIASISFPGQYLSMQENKVSVSKQIGEEEKFFLLKNKDK